MVEGMNHKIPIQSRDEAEPTIVEYLRRVHRAAVFVVGPHIPDTASAGFPDLAIWHGGRLFLAEVKTFHRGVAKRRGVRSRAQRRFAVEFPPVWVLTEIEDVDEMLAAESEYYAPVMGVDEGACGSG